MSAVASPSDLDLTRWYPHLHDAVIAGRRVRYLDIGSGPPVLLVHGIGCSWTHWAANLDALAAEHRVLAVDLPGFGASEALTPRSELTASADTLAGLLDHLGIDRTAAVGHSLGGLVCWVLATRAPERVIRLGLVGAATVALSPAQVAAIIRSFSVSNRWISRPGVARALLRRPRLRRLVIAALLAEYSAVTPELAVALLTPLTAAPGFLDALWAASRAMSLVHPAEMTLPTLAIWGTKDPIFPVATARRMVAAMPDARLLEVTGARHWPMLERPDQVNPALMRFLAAG